MIRSKEHLSKLLFRLQKGTATSSERALWETLEKKLGKAAASQLFGSTAAELELQQKLWQKIRPQHRFWNFRPWAAAAVVIFLLGLGTMAWWNSPPRAIPHQLLVNTSNAPQEHRLADGTIISLNQGAQLRYAPGFGTQHRSVALVGEAFFEVASNPDLPFEVHTQELTTRVTGTQFNIQQSAEQIKVTLVEGAVELQTDQQKIQLSPNIQAVFDRSDARLTQTAVEANLHHLWRQKTVQLDNIRLETFAQVFQSLYGNQLVFAEPQLKNKRFSIMFSPQQLASWWNGSTISMNFDCNFSLLINLVQP